MPQGLLWKDAHEPDPREAAEREFVARWNKTPNVIKNRGPLLSDVHRRAFRARAESGNWDWQAALEKFPLSHRAKLDWFLQRETVGEILEGMHSVPALLHADGFEGVWKEWLRWRREMGHPLKPMTVARQLKYLASIGTDRAIRALNHSMLNGYQGIFEPSEPKPDRNEEPNSGIKQWLREHGEDFA